MIIRPGVSDNLKEFLTQGRPGKISLQAENDGKKLWSEGIDIPDAPNQVVKWLNGDMVSKVKITIESVYRCKHDDIPCAIPCAIGEIEFRARH